MPATHRPSREEYLALSRASREAARLENLYDTLTGSARRQRRIASSADARAAVTLEASGGAPNSELARRIEQISRETDTDPATVKKVIRAYRQAIGSGK